ncbi:putative uncharacterized protein [Pseudomonas sp. StFLB209]|nr:putative uncharacterized protein [Pseudomonas sp. StFLB209]
MDAMRTVVLLLATLTCGVSQVQASSPDAWQQLDKTERAACLKTSQLQDVKVLGKQARFDDQVGYDALLLQGRYPQKHMNNRKGLELCLYHRQSGKATVTEWDSVEKR